MNDIHSDGTGVDAMAINRVRTGPRPDWACENSFDHLFKSEREAPITYLLLDTQVHAERREMFIHNAVRLETMEAVQHQSQWRLQFEPKTQVIILHSLKVRRGDLEIDQLDLGKAHVLQREEGLEHFVIQGWFTFLMILEDVRPGDLLDWAYTIENRPLLFPENCGHFFKLPLGLAVGKYHFSVRFNPARPLKWKSSATDLTPVESSENENTLWKWLGEKYAGITPEVNAPGWYITSPWLQISDFADWQTVAAGMAGSWVAEANAELLEELVKEIQSQEPDLTGQIEKLILLVQDGCRYLSVNLELGGHIPTSPAVVARRRFGDCKDLSFLLVNLLNKLGVPARPVLVHTGLRKSVDELLPLPWLFDHAVVEFEAEGKKRWIDTTLKDQGGGPFNRFIHNFELGLPVDAAATGLIKPPEIPGYSNLYKLHENFLLATSGEPSLLAVTFTGEGNQADMLRHQLKKAGLEEMAKQRLENIVNRFGNGKRVGLLQYRDDRAANQFVLAEVFEVSHLLAGHPHPQFCRFPMPSKWVAGVLAMPEKVARKAPFALPHPCQIVYVFDVDSPAIQQIKINEPTSRISSPFLQFRRDDKTGNGFFIMNISLKTFADFVPADQVLKYQASVEEIWGGVSRELSIQRGYSRSRQKAGFGALPVVPIKTPARLPIAIPPTVPNPPAARSPTPAPAVPQRKSSARENPRHKPYKQPTFPSWLIILGIMFFALVLFMLYRVKHQF